MNLHAVNHKLSLSEMTGKSPMILLGCNYEFDQGSVDEALAKSRSLIQVYDSELTLKTFT